LQRVGADVLEVAAGAGEDALHPRLADPHSHRVPSLAGSASISHALSAGAMRQSIESNRLRARSACSRFSA
jgi:hypothetical protein